MKKDRAVIVVMFHRKKIRTDVEVPLEITANELIVGLNQAYELGMNTEDIKSCYMKAENPVALLRGNKSLYEYGIRNGSVINITL